MSEQQKPGTLKEAFIAELMGDMGLLIEDAEALIKSVEALKASLPRVGEQTVNQVTAAGDKIRDGLARDAANLENVLSQISRETLAAAQVVDGSARRFQILALMAGLAGGVLGGLLIGFALANNVFG